MDLLKEQSEKAARKLSNVTLASSPDRAPSEKGSFEKPTSPTRSRKTFRGPGAKKGTRVWSPDSQGKRTKSRKPHRSRGSQPARRRRAGRSCPQPFLSRWLSGGPMRGEPHHRVPNSDPRRMGSWGWRWAQTGRT